MINISINHKTLGPLIRESFKRSITQLIRSIFKFILILNLNTIHLSKGSEFLVKTKNKWRMKASGSSSPKKVIIALLKAASIKNFHVLGWRGFLKLDRYGFQVMKTLQMCRQKSRDFSWASLMDVAKVLLETKQ